MRIIRPPMTFSWSRRSQGVRREGWTLHSIVTPHSERVDLILDNNQQLRYSSRSIGSIWPLLTQLSGRGWRVPIDLYLNTHIHSVNSKRVYMLRRLLPV